MNLKWIRIYAVLWWDVDHHVYGCPIQISVHTKRWFFEIRPFSGYAQGGDLRRMGDFSDYEKSRTWELTDQKPEFWGKHKKRLPKTPICTWCLHDPETCGMVACRDPHHVRLAAFPRHLWWYHVRRRGAPRCRPVRWTHEEV